MGTTVVIYQLTVANSTADYRWSDF